MPAKSGAQQRLFGMVRAAQKGEAPASPKIAKLAKRMSKKSVRDFAKTKRKGLPARVGNKKTRKEDIELELAVILEKILSPAQMTILFESDLDPSELERRRKGRRGAGQLGFPSLEPSQTTVDLPRIEDDDDTRILEKPKGDVGEIVNLIMTSLDPEEIDRVIRLLSVLKKHPWTPNEHQDIHDIADIINEDPGVVERDPYGRKPPKPLDIEKELAGGRKMRWKEYYSGTQDQPGLGTWEAEPEKRRAPERLKSREAKVKAEISKGKVDPEVQAMLMGKKNEDITRIAGMISDVIDEHCGKCGIPKEDASGTGGVAAGGEAITDDAPMTEEGKEGKHKCKLCGGECGPDKSCDTEGCPNNKTSVNEDYYWDTRADKIRKSYRRIGKCMQCGGPTIWNPKRYAWYCKGCGLQEPREVEHKTGSPEKPHPMHTKKYLPHREETEETEETEWAESKQPMESKNMKAYKLIKESARGRLTRRTHRMMDVASSGRVLTEEQWKDKVGVDNFLLALQTGLLQPITGQILGEADEEKEKKEKKPEKAAKGGEAVKEQPPMIGGEEGPPPFGGEEGPGEEGPGEEGPGEEEEEGLPPGLEGEGEEEMEEEEPISKHELAKFLEALMDRADEEALAMIQKAIASEEEMEGELGEAEEAEEAGEELEETAEGEEGEEEEVEGL